MHLIAVDEILIVSAAAKVQVCAAEGQFGVSCLRRIAFLHEAEERDDASTRAYHDHGDIMRSRHDEVGGVAESHHALSVWLAALLVLQEDRFEEARDETVSADLAITDRDVITGQGNSDSQFLWVGKT